MPDQSANIAALRAPGHKARVFFSVFNGASVMTADLTAAPTLPATDLAISVTAGSHTDVVAGMRFEIETSGGSFKGRGRVRFSGTISAANLPIRETSDGAIDIQSGDVVKVYNDFPLSDKLVEATSDFDPDGIAYSDQGSNPPPVACSGGPWAGRIADGGTFATITRTGNTSYTVDPDSASGVTHLWTLPTGVAFQAGSVNTDANPVLEADPGYYIVDHQVTDTDNGKSVTQHVPIRVHDDDDPPIECIVESLEADADGGWALTLRVFGSVTLTDFHDGALCALWVREHINDSVQSFGAASTGSSHIKMVGYLRREDNDGDARQQRLTFDVISPLARLGELLGLSKVMLREASPDAWNELKTLTIKRGIVQIAQFYSTLVESGFDFIFHSTFSDANFPALYLQKGDPLGQMRELADGRDARIICDRTGRFEVQRRLETLANADRAAETTTLTIAKQDIVGRPRISREHWQPLELFRARGFTAGATVAATVPVFSRWPGDAPGLGNETQVQEKLVADDVSDHYARTGRRGAAFNQVFVDANGVQRIAPQMDVALWGSYDVFDLYAEWVQFSLTASDNMRGIDPSDFRWLIRNISVEYQDGTARVNLTLDAETHGEPGTDDTPPADAVTGLDAFALGEFPAFDFNLDAFDQFNLGAGTVALGGINKDGKFYRCGPTLTGRGFDTASPIFEAIDLTTLAKPHSLSGTLLAFAVDPFSYQTASIDGWIATSTGIYTIEDLRSATPTLTLRHTFANTVTGIVIETSIAQPNWVLAIYYNETATNPGFFAVRSTNGTSFTEAQITAHRRTATGFSTPPIYMSINTGGVAYTQVFTSTANEPTNEYQKTTDHGATWTTVPSSELNFNTTDLNLLAGLHFPWHGNASEQIAYQGHVDVVGSDEEVNLYRVNGTTRTDITPATGGNNYTLRRFRGLSTSTADRQKVAVSGVAVLAGPTTSRKQWVSIDSGATWTLINENDDYFAVHLTDNHRVGYWWGENGAIGFMSDFATIQDKRGNIPTDFPGIGGFANILGL